MAESAVQNRMRKRPAWKQNAFAWVLHAGTRFMRDMAPHHRRTLFAGLSGRVLEIGAGAGANIPFYREDIHLMGIELNPFMFRYLRRESKTRRRNVLLLRGRAEALGICDNAVDAVVCTHVLCSVDDLDAALREILRTLKPGGRFVFLEHVAAPRTTILRRMQRLLRPGWHWLGDGCRLDRELWRALEQAGFDRLGYEHFRVPWALPAAPHIAGWARKPSR